MHLLTVLLRTALKWCARRPEVTRTSPLGIRHKDIKIVNISHKYKVIKVFEFYKTFFCRNMLLGCGLLSILFFLYFSRWASVRAALFSLHISSFF